MWKSCFLECNVLSLDLNFTDVDFTEQQERWTYITSANSYGGKIFSSNYYIWQLVQINYIYCSLNLGTILSIYDNLCMKRATIPIQSSQCTCSNLLHFNLILLYTAKTVQLPTDCTESMYHNSRFVFIYLQSIYVFCLFVFIHSAAPPHSPCLTIAICLI